MSEKKAVGLIGLGNMGQPIAERVAKFGPATVVFDMREEPLQALRHLGADTAASVVELAPRCDMICLIVNNEAQLREVVVGKDGEGLLEHVRPGTILVIHSTASPHLCRELASLGAQKDVVIFDAPVSGSETAAREGKLSLMVGGPATALEACRPVFQTYASNIFHMGEVGAGEAAKIANNLMYLVNTHAITEALRLARCAGIDPARMMDVAKASSGDSFALQKYDHLVEMLDDYFAGREGFQDTVAKDLRLAIGLGAEFGLPMPASSAALENVKQFWSRDR